MTQVREEWCILCGKGVNAAWKKQQIRCGKGAHSTEKKPQIRQRTIQKQSPCIYDTMDASRSARSADGQDEKHRNSKEERE